mmetsp:Transcript_14744/g.32063  ORF Transcript_14744/g.32063 Transcript_14744/m.32063 type:complete len:97 (-) Transcript_14744:3-293(-)
MLCMMPSKVVQSGAKQDTYRRPTCLRPRTGMQGAHAGMWVVHVPTKHETVQPQDLLPTYSLLQPTCPAWHEKLHGMKNCIERSVSLSLGGSPAHMQ